MDPKQRSRVLFLRRVRFPFDKREEDPRLLPRLHLSAEPRPRQGQGQLQPVRAGVHNERGRREGG